MDVREEASLGLADLLLSSVSPQEAELLTAFGPALLRQSSGPARGDGVPGFGIDEVSWLTASVPVAGAVVSYLGEVVRGATEDAVKDRVGVLLRTFRGRRGIPVVAPVPPTRQPPALPLEIVSRAGQIAYERALAIGLDDARARLLSSAVNGSLAATSGS